VYDIDRGVFSFSFSLSGSAATRLAFSFPIVYFSLIFLGVVQIGLGTDTCGMGVLAMSKRF